MLKGKHLFKTDILAPIMPIGYLELFLCRSIFPGPDHFAITKFSCRLEHETLFTSFFLNFSFLDSVRERHIPFTLSIKLIRLKCERYVLFGLGPSNVYEMTYFMLKYFLLRSKHSCHVQPCSSSTFYCQ